MAVLDSYYSEKIKKMSFIMAFMVLVIHSTYDGIEAYPFAYWFQNFFKYGVCRVAVPTFFLFSGFLFFKSVGCWQECMPKVKKRISTLLVPYLLWNLIFVLIYFVLYLLPLQRFVNNTQVVTVILAYLRDYDILGVLSYLYFPQPVNVILWYVRDLFVFIILTPLLFLILNNRRSTEAFIAIIAVLTCAFYNNTLNGLFFFLSGAFIALHKDLDWFSELCSKAFIPALGIYMILSFYAPFNSIQNFTFLFLHIAGVMSVWRLYDLFAYRIRIPEKYLGYSFWVYCFHMPFYNILKKLNVALFGGGQFQYCLYFVISPIIAFVVIIGIGFFVRRYAPKVYGILTGNR